MTFVSFLVIPVWAQKHCGQNMEYACLEDSAIMGGQVGVLIQGLLTSYTQDDGSRTVYGTQS